MRQLYLITVVLTLTILMTACELKRNNPLDPSGNPDIVVPPKVTELTAIGSGSSETNKYVELTWKKNTPLTSTSGYYIYMGLAYNSAYARIDTVASNVSNTDYIKKRIFLSAPGFYYFKVSGYTNKDINGNILSGSLEGPLSEWAIAHVL